MAGVVVIDGERFELSGAVLELYHCDSPEADWNLKLERPDHAYWLSGTVRPSPRSAVDLPRGEFLIDNRDLDALFEELLGVQITTYPGGEAVCRACFTAQPSPMGIELISAFEFDWDRTLDPPGVSYPQPRSARLEIRATVDGIHPGGLP